MNLQDFYVKFVKIYYLYSVMLHLIIYKYLKSSKGEAVTEFVVDSEFNFSITGRNRSTGCLVPNHKPLFKQQFFCFFFFMVFQPGIIRVIRNMPNLYSNELFVGKYNYYKMQLFLGISYVYRFKMTFCLENYLVLLLLKPFWEAILCSQYLEITIPRFMDRIICLNSSLLRMKHRNCMRKWQSFIKPISKLRY